jgi:hypothetical protein
MAKADWDISDPAPSKNDAGDYHERVLLAAVVHLAVYEAIHANNAKARHWLNEPDGGFVMVASMLGLNSQLIRSKIERTTANNTRKRGMLC